MADRLTLVRALEDSGMNGAAADRVASEIYDAIHENVATKSDIATLQASTKSDIAAVRADLAAVRLDTESKLHQLELRLTLRVGAIVVAVSGALFAALHYWPPGVTQ